MENLKPIDLKKRRNWTLKNASLIAEEEGYQDTDQFREILKIFILNTVASSSVGHFLPFSFLKEMRKNGIISSRNGILKPE